LISRAINHIARWHGAILLPTMPHAVRAAKDMTLCGRGFVYRVERAVSAAAAAASDGACAKPPSSDHCAGAAGAAVLHCSPLKFRAFVLWLGAKL
jgi:hypothetical protein